MPGFVRRSLKTLFASAILTASAQAGVVSFSGSADVNISEFVSGALNRSGKDAGSFPAEALPLQVVTTLIANDNSFPSAAAAAAQFADPGTSGSTNPQEFAINLTLNSISPGVRYEATARSSEVREILYQPNELGAGTPSGSTQNLRGRLFIDGALLIVSAVADRDLTGANVNLNVTVVRSAQGEDDQAVFSGGVALSGNASGGAGVSQSGDFPVSSLILTDLSPFSSDLQGFKLLIIPSIQIDYTYKAVVGTPLTLTATVEVQAANVPDNVGVAAVLGTPADTILQVLSSTNGSGTAAKVLQAVDTERADPTGDYAFPAAAAAANGPFGLCGLLGFEMACGLLALFGVRAARFGAARRIPR